MNQCLDETMIEDLLAGDADEHARRHVRGCAACRQRVRQATEMRSRLRAAFASVHAPAGSADRVRAAIGLAAVAPGQGTAPGGPAAGPPPGARAGRRRRWLIRLSVLSAAAALAVIVSLAALTQFTGPAEAQAAAELVQLHKANLAGNHEMVSHSSRQEVEAYLAGRLDFVPVVPDQLGERRIRGCCVSRFLGRRAGNFVIEGRGAPVSIIVSDANSRPLRMGRKIELNGRSFWVCAMEGFYTVAVQDGSLVYCAVGDHEPEELAGILNTLLGRRTR